jgi:hypothetical protein
MITLERFSSLSDALNLKHCLEAEGIPVTLGGESLGGIVGTPYSVNLLHDGDLERAMEVKGRAVEGA